MENIREHVLLINHARISVDPTDPSASFEYAGDRKHVSEGEALNQRERTPPADSVELSAGVCMRVPFSRVVIKTPMERKRTSSNVDFAGVSTDIMRSTVAPQELIII